VRGIGASSEAETRWTEWPGVVAVLETAPRAPKVFSKHHESTPHFRQSQCARPDRFGG